MTQSDENVERRAHALYRQSYRNLPLDSRQALQKVRMNALAAGTRRPMRRRLFPAGALTAAALLLVFAWGYQPLPQQTQPAAANATINAAVQDSDSEELYLDLDFYRWLATHGNQLSIRN